MENILKVEPREGEKSGQVRKQGFIPAVIYNRSLNQNIKVELKAFDKVFRHASIHQVITLEFPDGSQIDTLVRQVNLDKRARQPEHVDFYALSGEPVEIYVTLRYQGTPHGVRNGGVFEEIMRDVLVKVPPKQIPEYIAVDVSSLGLGDSLHLADLQLPEGVILAMDPGQAIATVVAPESVERLEAEAAAATLEPTSEE